MTFILSAKNLHLFAEDTKIHVIPITDENYILISLAVKVACYTDHRWVEKHVYENLRFIDSSIFMASSLDKLVGFLPAENFRLLDNRFHRPCSDVLQLIHLKSFHPFFYLDSQANFQEKSMRRLEKWTNCLQYGKVSITPQQFETSSSTVQQQNMS